MLDVALQQGASPERRTSIEVAPVETAAALQPAAANPPEQPPLNIVTSWALRSAAADMPSRSAVPKQGRAGKTVAPASAAPWPAPSAAQLRKVLCRSGCRLQSGVPSCLHKVHSSVSLRWPCTRGWLCAEASADAGLCF